MPSHRADAPHESRSRAQRRDRERDRGRRRAAYRSGFGSLTGSGPGLSSLSLPQAGIAGALGLATIAAPLSGLMSSLPAKAVPNSLVSAEVAASPAFPLRMWTRTAVQDLRLVPDDISVPAIPPDLMTPNVLLVTRPSRGGERAVLPGCFGEVPRIKADNGQLPNRMLCTLWDGKHQLRADAAVSIAKLNVAYTQRFGHPMCVSSAYRILADQYRVKAERGWFAAEPGRSEHGQGVAVDLCDGVGDGAVTYVWLRANAPRYGWDNPGWARPGGSGPLERWHWEFRPAGTSDRG